MELSFFGTFRIYQNKMYTYETLVNHYQSQTLFAYSEKIIKDEFILSGKKVPSSLSFNIGEVMIVSLSSEQYQITSQLTSGFSEKKEVTIVKKISTNDSPQTDESKSEKGSIPQKNSR